MSESAIPRHALLIADPGDGLRWLGWSDGWPESAAADAVESLETLTVSRQITDVAGFLHSGNGAWIVSRGGLMPEKDTTQRYWREAFELSRRDLELLRGNPFRLMPVSPPDPPTDALRIRLRTRPEALAATVEDDLSRLNHLRTRPWGPSSWSLETILAAALDSDRTLVTGSAISIAALELLILLLPPSLRCELTFHTYALAEPRKPIPRLVFTQFEDDWLFPETAAFGHRLPATELRITRRAQDAASELLGLLDTPDRLAEAHTLYESSPARNANGHRSLLGPVQSVLRMARMLSVRTHGHAGAGLHVLMEELSNDASPNGHRGTVVASRGDAEVLVSVLLDAFEPDAIGEAIADVLRAGDVTPAAPLFLMQRFFARHPIGSAPASAFALPFTRVPAAALPSEPDEAAQSLRELIQCIVPEPAVEPGLPSAWDASGDSLASPAGSNAADTELIDEPIEVSPDTAVLKSVVAGMALEAAKARALTPSDHARFAPASLRAPEATATPEPAADIGPVLLETKPEPAADVEPHPTPAPLLFMLPAGNERWWRFRPWMRKALAAAASVAVLAVIGFGARALLRAAPSVIPVAAARSADPQSVEQTPPAGIAPDFTERLAQAHVFAANADWSNTLDAISISFTGLSSAESFTRDSLIASVSLQLARATSQDQERRTELFAQTFNHATLALAIVAPFAAGTEFLRLVLAEACIEGSLACDPSELTGNLVFAARSMSAEIRSRANELLARTASGGNDGALFVSSDGGSGRL